VLDWQFLAARMVADTRRRMTHPLLTRIPDTRSATLARRDARGRFAAALQEGVARAESASADSACAHGAAPRPRLGLSHPRIAGTCQSSI
jgi:hypothetical protein